MANSLAHTKWVCKYHIVFTPKYRRKVIYYQLRKDIREIIRDLCKWKGVEIIEGAVMPDHIHLLVRIKPNETVSVVVHSLKQQSTYLMWQKHHDYLSKFYWSGQHHLWTCGYFASTIGNMDMQF